MRKKKSHSRQMRDAANKYFDKHIVHDLTKQSYKRNFKKFVEFCRSKGFRNLDEGKEYIQEYYDSLIEKYSVSSCHTFLAPVTKFYGINMSEINKPKRVWANYSKGRAEKTDKYRTYSDINHPKWRDLVEFQRRCGLRKNDLRNLCGGDWREDDADEKGNRNFYVHVRKGKGGKSSDYLIKPEDVEFVKSYFKDKGENERIFDPKLLKNDLNLHRLRAQHAEDMYYYYLNKIKNNPEYRKELETLVKRKCTEGNLNPKTGKPKRLDPRDLKGLYHLRGATREKAKNSDKPVTYDRLCLKATSCLNLSHYRISISILYVVLYD